MFRGANGPWKTGDYEYHLKRDAAKNLLGLVLETYEDMHGEPPKELFIHGQTYFNDEEWDAFCEAAPSATNVIGVRIRTTGGETKLFRDGDYPVLRGTALLLDHQTAYLWTTGYVPQLDTYIGPETPNPLHITVLRSKSRKKPELMSVLEDIMGLTKINYNSCNFNDGLPVTVRFAQMVGDVLTMGSAKGRRRSEERPLISANEVLRFPLDEVLVLPEGQYPIRARHIRYFEDRHFAPIDRARKWKALPTIQGGRAHGGQVAVGKLSGLAAPAERTDPEVFGEAVQVFQTITDSAKRQRRAPARV